MEKKKKPTLSYSIKSLSLVIPSFINIICHMTQLMYWEARLAINAIINLTLLIVFFVMLLIMSWVGLSGLLLVKLIALHWSWVSSFLTLFLLNLFFLIIVSFFILRKISANK